ncbi:MAG: LamG domain-containing protein, partial [Woeseiaceae bacterium]|nr:LamG domain-containing protein [Woeseiaceae bacterium]
MKNAKSVLLAFVSSLVLSACGGGASTTDLPQSQGGGNTTGNAPYAGPVARDADVLKFQQELWSNARSTDRCGNCHNESVLQVPMFVRSDDVNLAYDDAVTITDTQQPSLSRMVEKVSSGHNCWVADPNVCGEIMTTWIENWVGAAAGGGRQIVLTPPVSNDPGASLNFPADPFGPPSFETILHQPILTQYCSNCHSSESANAIQPYFADPDINVAYD